MVHGNPTWSFLHRKLIAGRYFPEDAPEEFMAAVRRRFGAGTHGQA